MGRDTEGEKVSSSLYALTGEVSCVATLSCATIVSKKEVFGFSLACGAVRMERKVMAGRYKPVAKKVRPLALNPPLKRPELSRDPYQTPLKKQPWDFRAVGRITEERVKGLDFGPEGWLSGEEVKLLLNVVTLREKGVAFEVGERGLLKRYYGEP